jgi:HK97 family phage major capsid protein
MSVGSDPDGGYVVLPNVEGTIRQISRDYSPLRDLASAVTISKGDSYEVVLDMDEVGATWVGETAARPATSTPTLKVASIPVHEIYAMPMITQKLLDDASFDLGAFLEGKIADKFARTEPAAFASGDGVGKPRGFLTYATDPAKDFTRAWGKFQHIAAGSTTPTDKQLADGLVAVATTLRSPYRANSTWLMSGDTLLRVRQIKDTTDHYIWQPGLQAGQPDRLLGYPVAICEDMPAIGSGNTPVALASWKAAYQIVDRHGLRLLRDPFTAKPHTLFYAYKRVGGDVVDFNALKFLKISNS